MCLSKHERDYSVWPSSRVVCSDLALVSGFTSVDKHERVVSRTFQLKKETHRTGRRTTYHMEERERLIRDHLRKIRPLPRRAIPRPWEDLSSEIACAARKMGYEYPEWILHPQGIAHAIAPGSLPFLRRRLDYQMLTHLLQLDERTLYGLTLHRLFSALKGREKDYRIDVPGTFSLIERPLLEHDEEFFWPELTTQVCPLCLDEAHGYDRLYWRLRSVLLCPRHRVLLNQRCPACAAAISALRPHLTRCSACGHGDYRQRCLALLPEDQWLYENHCLLFTQLGIGEEEGIAPLPTGFSPLALLPSWQYFGLHTDFLTLFGSSFPAIRTLRSFLAETLPVGALQARFPLTNHLLLHYVLAAWPAHFLVLLERCDRALQERFHYWQNINIVQDWRRALIEGNFWCPAQLRERPFLLVLEFSSLFQKHFRYLQPFGAIDPYAAREVNAGVFLERELQPVRQEYEAVPCPWEDITSLLLRVARRLGLSDAQRLLKSDQSGERPIDFDARLPVLHTSQGYAALGRLLHLPETMLYSLTLHRFAPALLPPSDAKESAQRRLLSRESVEHFFLPLLTSKVCPLCFQEQEVYARVYWRLKLILSCPRHRCLLFDACPSCHAPIPTLRSSFTTCPYCKKNDRYRLAKPVFFPTEGLLFAGEVFLMHTLGIEDGADSRGISLFQASPLLSFEPWLYFQLLERFGEVCRYLLPEQLRLAFCQHLVSDDTPFSLASAPKATRARAQQLVLFHALFAYWPRHWSAVLTTLQRVARELVGDYCPDELAQCDQWLHVLTTHQADPDTIASGLKHLFESWTRLAQQQALTQCREELLLPTRHRLITQGDNVGGE